MHEYLVHHPAICGVKHDIFEQAVDGKANHLAIGAIIVAAKSKSRVVTAEQYRIGLKTGKAGKSPAA